jgi:hypothetical protein
MSVPGNLVADLAIQSAIGAIGGSGYSAGREEFKGTYEKDSIILFGGIAGSSYNNSALISQFTGGIDFSFVPMVGAKILSWQAGLYPFANQAIAANALIAQPLPVSMIGICPVSQTSVGYLSKNKAISGLSQSLNKHNNAGGLYSVVTPAYTFTNCLLLDVYDISPGESLQKQYLWRFDFIQPLLTAQQAQAALSSLMNKLNNGTYTGPALSWSAPPNANFSSTASTDTTGLIAPSALQ